MNQQQRWLAGAWICALVAVVSMQGQSSVNDALRAHSVHATVAAEDAAPATIEAALQEMFAAADVVFTGEVSAVERDGDVVTVRFTVEDGIRGVPAGESYALREWSGLWADNAGRYAVGQRLLLLLHAPSVAGLASPVSDGAIPVSGDAVTGTADLRWVALHAVVTDAARLRPMAALHAAGGSFAGADARMRVESAQSAITQSATRTRAMLQPPDVEATADSVAVQVTANDVDAHMDRAVVMDMLHAWQQLAERAQ